MAKGPLLVRWGNWTLAEPQAGALTPARIELENAGSATWDERVRLSYHWLDGRGNPIVWEGDRFALPPLRPGESSTVEVGVRAPIPPGRYGFALDLLAGPKVWFSELGSEMPTGVVEVHPRGGTRHAELPAWVEPAADWEERVAAAHAEGYAVVAGAIAWRGGPFRRTPEPLELYKPGPGRIPGFAQPLLCPSVLDGVELERLPDVEGLPAYAPPGDEPWLYDGRIVVTVDPRRAAAVGANGHAAQSSSATRSSTRLNT